MIRKTILPLVAATSVLVAFPPHYLGVQQQRQLDSQQRPAGDDPIRELNLSPEQRERIRAIREQLQAERALINKRLRETNEALEEALDADNPDESLVEQRVRDFATAWAAATRMRALSEVRIRRVLTPEQLVALREMRKIRRERVRERQRENMELRRQERVERRRGLSDRRNGLGPLLPGRTNRPQKPRP